MNRAPNHVNPRRSGFANPFASLVAMISIPLCLSGCPLQMSANGSDASNAPTVASSAPPPDRVSKAPPSQQRQSPPQVVTDVVPLPSKQLFPEGQNPYAIEKPAGVGTAATIHVAVTGDDNAAGTSQAPLKTLAAAIAKVQPGGIIEMRTGTYQGAVINQGYGNANAWVTLRAAGGASVTLQGNPRGAIYPTLYFYHSSCDEFATAGSVCASSYWRVEGLKILGTAGSGDSNAVKIDTQHVQVADSVLCCAGPDVVKIVRTANDAAILSSEIYADRNIVQFFANSQGVDITGADRVRIVGNYFHDLPDVALYAKGNARETIFAANRVHHTGYGHQVAFGYNAIMLGQQTDESRLVDGPYESYDGLAINNIVSNVSGACLAASSSLNARFHHNTCIDTGLLSHGGILISTEGGLAYTPNKGAEFVNNIFSTRGTRRRMISNTDREYTKPTQAPLTIKNNLYWAGGYAPQFVWIPDYYNEHPMSDWLATYTSLYGAADTSRSLDPSLNADLAPRPASPSIGTALAGYARYDFNGRLRPAKAAVGALEAASGKPALVGRTRPQTSTPSIGGNHGRK